MTTLSDAIRKLADAAGLDEHVVSDVQIMSAIRYRMRASQHLEATDYDRWASAIQTEKAELFEDLLVRESWFFRDKAPFDALRAQIESASVPKPGNTLFKVLSAPCANGEEPYSLAIALYEAGMDGSAFQIDAVDISQRGLEHARAGCYKQSALREVPPAIVQRYFSERNNNAFAVCSALKDVSVFHHANLMNLPSSIRTQRYNAIYCRNALIYLNEPARDHVIRALSEILLPGGLLVVGHAESALVPRDRFVSFGKPGSFAFRKEAPQATNVRSPRLRAPGERRFTRPRVTVGKSKPGSQEVIPASQVAADQRAHSAKEGTQDLLMAARNKADAGDYAASQADLLAVLQISPTTPEAHHLLGLVYAAQNQFLLARQSFERALYLEPDFAPSIEHLSLLFESQGAETKAKRLRRRVNVVVNKP